jgi:RimJ/RimL family protein N-acetyltransferase
MNIPFEQLETERLKIRRFMNSDLEPLVAYRSLPEIARFEGQYTLERGQKLITFMKDRELGASGWFQFALEEKNSGELIGDLAFHFVELPRTAEIGYSLNPSHWGQGLAFEATSRLLELAFTGLELHRLMAYTAQDNLRSQHLLERLGFRLEGRTLESYEVDGVWIDEFQYALLEREWSSRTTVA